ncbi:M28 family peptidase [Chitinophaga rhizosphaerae]|uniref:M28 family peptidase n=1 Tax=Chitinophaga rhizosphaerae TaxID=1864947 RepID=UPI000F7FDDAC|nr:M28 family peptidase [Chitinophaga rhizosphaerae]
MKKQSMLACLLAIGTAACAQKAATPLKRTAATPYAETITAAKLKKHLFIVAGDEMEGRETGTPGQYKAAKYIIEQFRAAGLRPGAGNGEWEQPFSLMQDTLAQSSIQAGGKTFSFGQEYYASVKEAVNQQLGTTPAVFAGYGVASETSDPWKGMDGSEKIVVLAEEDGAKKGAISDKLRNAAGHGAVAVFMVSERYNIGGRGGSRMRRTGLYWPMMKTMEYIPNTYFVSPEVASAIFGKQWPELVAAAKTGTTPITGQVTALEFKKGTEEIKSSNVLGILPGTDLKDEYVFVTAHYDHIGVINGQIHNGADDDGSGTVSVIAMADAFMKAKKAGKGPRRSIVFMTVSGEEKGLLGSQYYTDHPIYPLAQTVTDLNIDMIGRIDDEHKKDTNYVYIIGDDKLSSDLRPISEAANRHTGLNLDYKYNDPNDPNRFYYRSDHYMFAQHKIPIIFYFNGVHEDYHRSGDKPEKIHYNLLAKRAKLVFYTAWEVANRKDRLKVDRNEK